MKKFYFLILALLIVGTSFAQHQVAKYMDNYKPNAIKSTIEKPVNNKDQILLEEDFENGGDLPTDWTVIDNDGDGVNWFALCGTGSTTAYSGECNATSASWDQSPLTPDNYLITPQIDLTSASGTVTLKYYTIGQDPDWADEHYKVVISTTDASDVANFTDNVFEETLSTSTEYYEREVDLTSYIGQSIYIAWVHYNITDMFRINIDMVTVSIPDAINDVNGNGLISIYPNPANDKIFVSNAENSVVAIYNVLGEKVRSCNIFDDESTIDLSDLNQGAYFVKVLTDNEIVATQKIILTK